MRTLLWAVAVTAAAPLVFGMVQTQDLGDAMESASADSVSADDGVIYRDQLPGTYPLYLNLRFHNTDLSFFFLEKHWTSPDSKSPALFLEIAVTRL